MATVTKSAILRVLIEGVLTDIMVKTNVDNVVLMDGDVEKTLAAKLAEIIATLNNKANASDVTSQINTAISDLIGGAPETYNTLKEIADYISSHEDVVTALNAAIGNKVDKVEGKGLSTNDFTNALKEGLEYAISKKDNWDSAYTHSQSAHAPADAEKNTVVGVQVNGVDLVPDSGRKVNVAVPVNYVQTTTPAGLKEGDLFLQIVE